VNLWLGRTRTYGCSDGSVRVVYKSPDRAFPLLAKDWHTHFAAAVDAVRNLKAELGAAFDKEISAAFLQLDQMNRSMQCQFRAAYAVYQTNPCALQDFLVEQVKGIINHEGVLRQVVLEMRSLAELWRAGPADDSFRAAIGDTLAEMARTSLERKIREAFVEAAEDLRKWRSQC